MQQHQRDIKKKKKTVIIDYVIFELNFIDEWQSYKKKKTNLIIFMVPLTNTKEVL